MARLAKRDNLPIIRFDVDGEMIIHTDDQKLHDMLWDFRYGDNALENFAKFFFNSIDSRGRVRGSFTKPFNSHRKAFAQRISDVQLPYIWGVANRSFGKTTLIWAEIIRRIVFRISPFVLYVSSELKLAEQRTESIRLALLTNPLITEIFGTMVPQYVDGVREVWGKKAWKLVDPITGQSFCVVVPKSDNAVVNGLVDFIEGRQQRPSLILCDDITDRRRVMDEAYREEHVDWLWGTLFPCVETEIQPDPRTHKWSEIKPGHRPPWQIMIIDTCKHSQAAVEVAAQQPDWFGDRYATARETEPGSQVFVSIVDYLTDEQVQEQFEKYKRVGKENRFFKEYLCTAGASNDNKFPTEFQYYTEDLSLNDNKDVVRFIIVDPARTANPRSAFTAMLSVAVDCKNANVYLRDMIHERLNYEDIGFRLCAFASRHNCDILAVEDAGLHDAIRGPLEKFAQKMGIDASWIWLPAARKYIESEDGERRTIKEARASSALWLYRPFEPTHPNGHVWHSESIKHGPLEQQMISFPDCRGWDAIDTLGYVDYVMRNIGLYFDKQVEHPDEENRIPVKQYDPWDDILNESYEELFV